MVIAYGCCVGSWDKVRRYVEPRIGGQLLTVHGATSIAEAYNEIIDTARGVHDLEALVLLHDDLEIIDHDFETKLCDALTQRDVALVGVAGARGAGTLAWWNADVIGHQLTDSGMIDFGPRTGDVEVLEGSLLALSPWAVENLRFDTRYGGFHGYDDIGYEAVARGKRVVVADIDTHHHTHTGWRSSAYYAAWQAADIKFREKWKK